MCAGRETALARRPISRADRRLAGRAFSLTELLVSVSIVAIVTGLLLPSFAGARASARHAATVGLTNTVATAMSQFRQMNNRLPGAFSQDELASPTNLTGFTSMENALLDLAGGVEPANGEVGENSFELRLAGRGVRVNPQMIGAPDGPGYLPLAIKGRDSLERYVNAVAPTEGGKHQVVDLARGPGGSFDLPDVLDAWGRPIMLWAKNATAGRRPFFTSVHAPAGPDERGARYYWWTNRGYLAAPSQATRSAIGAVAPLDKCMRSLEAAIGDPMSPDPASGGQAWELVPLVAKGDFVLHAAGRDGVFMTNGGNTQVGYRYIGGGMAISDGTVGGVESVRNWLTTAGLDDVIMGRN